MDIASTKMTNTIATNVSINSAVEKVIYTIDCYILHTVLLVIIFAHSFISDHITLDNYFICYHYAKHRPKQKRIGALTRKNGK